MPKPKRKQTGYSIKGKHIVKVYQTGKSTGEHFSDGKPVPSDVQVHKLNRAVFKASGRTKKSSKRGRSKSKQVHHGFVIKKGVVRKVHTKGTGTIFYLDDGKALNRKHPNVFPTQKAAKASSNEPSKKKSSRKKPCRKKPSRKKPSTKKPSNKKLSKKKPSKKKSTNRKESAKSRRYEYYDDSGW